MPETLTVPLPCPHCQQRYTVEVPVSYEKTESEWRLNFDGHVLRLAVHAHVKQHLS